MKLRSIVWTMPLGVKLLFCAGIHGVPDAEEKRNTLRNADVLHIHNCSLKAICEIVTKQRRKEAGCLDCSLPSHMFRKNSVASTGDDLIGQ